MPAPVPQSIYQIKVTLNDSKPPVWRRVLVPDTITLHQLHTILQIVMGWTNSHLHQFIVDSDYYGEPEEEDGYSEDLKNEKRYRLNQFVKRKGFKFMYEYDFGDNWEHTVHVEAILPVEKGRQYPVCLVGKRACPPEDIGGVRGYDDLLKIFFNPKHPEHKDMMEEFGDDFDPESFDIDDVNLGLRKFAARARMAKY
ncbi:MAG: plasmid pRiA4b ORF-3 family protein [Chloroflexota bacterium]